MTAVTTSWGQDTIYLKPDYLGGYRGHDYETGSTIKVRPAYPGSDTLKLYNDNSGSSTILKPDYLGGYRGYDYESGTTYRIRPRY